MAEQTEGRVGALIYLLDSTLLIDAINQHPAALAFLEKHPEICAISPITRAEVLAGTQRPQVAVTTRFLQTFPCLPLGEAEADSAGEFRRSHKLKLPDAFQAAIARTHKMKLITRNTKDFSKVKFSFVEIPYTIPNSQ